MYKIYQLQRVNEVITHTDDNDYSTYDIEMRVIAQYTEHKEIPIQELLDSLWDRCNVGCWDSSWKSGEVVVKKGTTLYPTEHFQGYCYSDIVIETKDGLYQAQSFGWKQVPDLEEAMYRIIWSCTFINWNDIRNKSAMNNEKLWEIGKIINQEREERYKRED